MRKLCLIKKSFAYYLNQDALIPLAVKFPVEYAFPRAKIKPAIGNRNNNFPAHYRALKMRIAIIFSCQIVHITVHIIRSQFLNPGQKIFVQATLIVIYENA